MAKKTLSKAKKNQKDLQKKAKKLKKLNTNQVDTVTSPALAETALQKIQQQLHSLSDKRQKEKEYLKALKKEIRTIKKHLAELDNELLDTVANDNSSHKLQKQLKHFQKKLDKKTALFEKNTRKLQQEISLFGDLEQRVIKRIQSLEQDNRPWQQKLDYLGVSHEELFDKISHFESELSQLDEKIPQPDQGLALELKDFSETLEQLQGFVEQVQSHQQQQDTSLKLLQTDTGNIRKSLQQVQALQQAEKQRIDEQLNSLSPRLDSLEQDLSRKNQEIEQDVTRLKQQTESINEQLHKDTSAQSALSLVSDLKSVQEQSAQKIQQLDQHFNSLQEAQQQLIQPLEQQLNELSQELQALRQAYNEQEQTQDSDAKQFESLLEQVNQFDTLLKQSQEELNQHIQVIRDSDNAQSEQLAQLNSQLEQLAQQLNDVAEQSAQLQGLFTDLQDQQQTDQQQTRELSEQVQTQQQQLNELDEQVQQFTPLLEQTRAQSEQLDKLSLSVEELQSRQAESGSFEQAAQKKINSLSSKLDLNYSDLDTRLDQLHTNQLDQKTQLHDYHQFQYQQQNQQKELSGELHYLGTQIKNRSQLFGIGLISVLAISALLFFNQDKLQSRTADPALVAEVKKEVKNETFSKINALTKQNSIILNSQLGQLRESIEEIRAQQAQLTLAATAKTPAEPMPEANTTGTELNEAQQEQQQALKNRLAELETELKTEQQNIKQSVSTLSEQVTQIDTRVADLEKTVQEQATKTRLNRDTQGQPKKQAIIPVTAVKAPFYTIQLSGSYHTESIKDFMIRYQLINKTRIYQTELNNKPWFIVVSGQYSTFSQARQAKDRLSADLKQLKPWIRKLP